MPSMTGVALLEKVRALKPEVVRILITAYPDVNVAIDAINRGQVKRYLSKPFDPAELRVVVRQELEVFELSRANQRLTNELSRLVDELLRANKELKELDRMKDHFLANVSHELKTPLVSGIGYIDLILSGGMGPVDGRMERGLRVAHRNLERLLGLIEDLLALARMRYKPESLTLTRFPLGTLVEECVESLKGRSRKSSLAVRVSIPRNLPPVEADERKVHSVLTNVLSNAEKFTPEHARIELRVVRRGPKAVVRVADNGIGVEAKGAFPYFKHQEDAAAKKYGGLGIGLTLVRQILQAHGCSIELARRRQGGTVVTFDLPLAAS
jgi:signal transduction histidine kinase